MESEVKYYGDCFESKKCKEVLYSSQHDGESRQKQPVGIICADRRFWMKTRWGT